MDWVRISERLPKEDTVCLLVHDGSVWAGYWREYDGEPDWYEAGRDGYRLYGKVTHWQDLPEPPPEFVE